MSTLHCPIASVQEVKPHPNADRLEVATIQGWQVVVAKDSVKAGDLGVYVPPDTQVPEKWSAPWGVQPYLARGVRVKAVKLRGEPSFGFFVPLRGDTAAVLEGTDRTVGDDVSDLFDLTKYVPQERIFVGDQRPENPMFTRYTDIENLRHFPDTFEAGETVWVTEKIHGTNSRIGIVDGEAMAGSHRVQRKHPSEAVGEEINYANPGSSVYWFPWSLGGVARLMATLQEHHRQVVMYGEIYGAKIQKLHYGHQGGDLGYRVFDIMCDGKYLDYDIMLALCSLAGVEAVPVLYKGPFDLDVISALAEGRTTLVDNGHIREGVVVRPLRERVNPRYGRVIMKWVGAGYLTGDFEE